MCSRTADERGYMWNKLVLNLLSWVPRQSGQTVGDGLECKFHFVQPQGLFVFLGSHELRTNSTASDKESQHRGVSHFFQVLSVDCFIKLLYITESTVNNKNLWTGMAMYKYVHYSTVFCTVAYRKMVIAFEKH